MLCRSACIRIVLITAFCCLTPTLHAQVISATLAKELKTAQQLDAILAIPPSKPAVSASTSPALDAIRIQASTGDARAEFSLGAHYYYGRGGRGGKPQSQPSRQYAMPHRSGRARRVRIGFFKLLVSPA